MCMIMLYIPKIFSCRLILNTFCKQQNMQSMRVYPNYYKKIFTFFL